MKGHGHMNKRLLLWLWLAISLLAPPVAAAGPLRIGILPVLDTLPLQVAVADQDFHKRGLDVALVPFASAMERDLAMQSGNLDGYFGDLINTLMLIRNQMPMRIVTICYRSTPGQRMFALVAAPKLDISDPSRIGRRQVGISNATIIEYLLDKMEPAAGIPAATLVRTEVKKIPIRLQMLLAGQLDLALLPEPLVSLAEQSGARVVVTDERLDLPLTVICLHQRVLDSHPEKAAAFLDAYRDAVARITAEPERYRRLMAETCGIPKPLVAAYPIPRYPRPELPEPGAVAAVEQWMIGHDLLKQPFAYDRLVVTR